MPDRTERSQLQTRGVSAERAAGACIRTCNRTCSNAHTAPQADCGLPLAPDEYAAGALRFGLVEAVSEWARGTPFVDICGLTDVPEGVIVRTIVRLDETCREFRNAARLMGNSALFAQATPPRSPAQTRAGGGQRALHTTPAHAWAARR